MSASAISFADFVTRSAVMSNRLACRQVIFIVKRLGEFMVEQMFKEITIRDRFPVLFENTEGGGYLKCKHFLFDSQETNARAHIFHHRIPEMWA